MGAFLDLNIALHQAIICPEHIPIAGDDHRILVDTDVL
jgi:hypothetical protein